MDINTSRGAKGISPGDWRHKPMLLRRQRLSDITNLSNSVFSNGVVNDAPENRKTGSPVMANECIAKLFKENNVLMRALAERNTEVQNLRLMVAKLNQQNWQLAQAHSQMQAELNLGKDRLKAAQHELGCTSTALRVKTQELEEQKKLNKQSARTLEGGIKAVDTALETSQLLSHKRTCLPNKKRPQRSQSLVHTPVTNQITTEEDNHFLTTNPAFLSTQEPKKLNKQSTQTLEGGIKAVDTALETSQLLSHKRTCLPNKKRPQRSQSLVPTPVTNQITTEEDNQRRTLRRKLTVLKAESCVPPSEDLFEIEDAKYPICSGENKGEIKDGGCSLQPKPFAPTIPTKSVKEEVEDVQVTSSLNRTSLGRPLRRAAEKVHCYKELPLNVKLRRSE
ncbi:shugoshin-1-like isoform X2 [Phalaenopsis equestris]|uniref:shugoshin-1-like isoform X2 n=1 Tax=Phalaenopsis equestris TaxID=78828 RepID=UPI0009E658EB|nr:shugoshin-1-like isoform X2 [Phalaenopsis equestris]